MQTMRIFRVLTSALLLALLAAIVPSMPVFAQISIYVYPDDGNIGESINVYGHGFTPGATVYVYFSSDDADFNDRIDEEVTAYELVEITTAGTATDEEGVIDTYFTVPTKLTDGDTRENVRNGTYYVYATYSTSRLIKDVTEFTVEGASEIILSPEDGVAGTEVRITGVSFDDREDFTIEYDGEEVPVNRGDTTTDSDGEFQCYILIPASTAGIHSIIVTGEDSDLEAEAEFNVVPKITVNPQAGVAGDIVNVRGTGFGDRASLNIFFGNFRVATGRTTDRYGSFEIAFEILPTGAGTHYVEVIDGSGNSAREKFTIGATTINLSPTTGYAGTEITVSGVGFAASKMVTIKFANVQVRTTATDASGKFSDKFIVPRYASGNYNVALTDGVNTVTTVFTITASISLSQSTGNVGTSLTINGNGFSGAVTIKYDDTAISTTNADASGMFIAHFKVPAGTHGEHIITASDAMNTIRTEFTMESTPPPTPTPLQPAAGSREKSQGVFKWELVTDPSGVTYMLQIASDVHFTNILLEKQGLSIPEYTVTKTERLPSTSKEAPYYWRVKAIDGASNESAWSAASSFYVSFFPDWARNTLIVIGSLAAALGIFWLGIKTAKSSKNV